MNPRREINTVNICNVQINNLSLDEALAECDNIILSKTSAYIVTPNVDHVVKMQNDEEFKQVYDNADLVLADGKPLILASKILGTPLKEKLSGSDLFPKICKRAAEKGYKVFFLGGNTHACVMCCEILQSKHKNIKITGLYCPPYDFENSKKENDKAISMIKNAKPDILFVGLGTPKQELWIYEHREELQVPLSIGIGASFDFYSGLVKRAPKWMQRCSLEWFWRLMMEPRRLWRRYLVDDTVFFWLLLKQKLGMCKK